jgi:hypothetical protein
MSELHYCYIEYEAPFGPRSVEEVLQALALAVAENWRDARDEWSPPEPEHPIDAEGWAKEFTRAHMTQLEFEGRPYWISREFGFSYSPQSSRSANFGVGENHDGTLRARIGVSDQQRIEVRGDRRRSQMKRRWEQIRRRRGERPPFRTGPDDDDPGYDEWWREYDRLEETPEVWPQNKRCIQHIISRLRAALPVRNVTMDEPLRGGEADPVT